MASKYFYKKKKKRFKAYLKVSGLLIILCGLLVNFYIFFPLISWALYIEPTINLDNIASPIPASSIIDSNLVGSLFRAAHSLTTDYTNAKNWYPSFKGNTTTPRISSYTLSIPKLNIKNAFVSTVDNDLSSHLINFAGTAIPPDKGNVVIFGHSTLPELFNSLDYKTIFAKAYLINKGDFIKVNIDNIVYNYQVFKIQIVDPDDMSPLIQTYDNRYLTLITCTPPGTIWKRLIIKSKLEG